MCAGVCGIEKPLTDFPAHKGTKDGCVSKCRDCTGLVRNKNKDREKGLGKDAESIRFQKVKKMAKQYWRIV